MKVTAIICAAGKGERAGYSRNKLLVPLHGEPTLYHTLRKFAIDEIDEIIVTSAAADFEEITTLCSHFNATVVLGGETRTESVKNALEKASGEIVLIHDGARPYLSKDLILRCIESVKTYKSGVAAIAFVDTAVLSTDGTINAHMNRDKLFAVQTPQAFLLEEIKAAYAMTDGTYNDDSEIFSKHIRPAHLVEGERENVKLTFKDQFTEAYLPTSPILYGHTIGFGVDVHAFCEGDGVVLGGVKIECDFSLVAHSDGDVVIHAVMDALLSGAGLDDIGHYFPDTDESLKNIDSGILLKKTMELVHKNGYSPVNLSISIQAQKPRLSEHIEAMRKNLSKMTGIAHERISIAAGTTERLGFVGEGLGITAYCTALLKEEHNG